VLYAFLIFGSLILFFFFSAAIISLREKETRASYIFFTAGFLLSVPYFLFYVFEVPANVFVILIFFGLPALIFLFLLFPFDPVAKRIEISPRPSHRFDERDIMFSRRRLKPGTARFEDYYRAHPEKKVLDDEWRRKPGLLNPKSRFYDPVWFSASESSFDTVEILHPYVNGVADKNRQNFDPQKITAFIKDWLLRSGAHSVGVTVLQDYHLYSHLGRQEPYGAEVLKEHRFAVAFTAEMDKETVDHAPLAPTVLESADQYLKVGVLAVKLAAFIRRSGYPARAHIDGNYRLICPLAARDAGLGEIGRMGLLITPELGPRVRIGVVTTDLPLITDSYKPDSTVIDFCSRCLKCADNCPSKAISFDDRKFEQGVLRWKINPEACFGYWSSAGTDCARCMKVCPYSHPDNLLHRTTRAVIKRNFFARYLAIKMDDVFYGRKRLP